jgi:hypothetical protein
MVNRYASCLFVVIAMGSLTVGGTPAEARSVAGSTGRTVLGADSTCFNVNSLGGIVRNDCGRTAWYEISLPADGSGIGPYNITVTARGEDNIRTVGCGAHGLSRDSMGIIWWTTSSPSLSFVSEFGHAMDIVFSVWVAGGGALIVDCEVHDGASVDYINY